MVAKSWWAHFILNFLRCSLFFAAKVELELFLEFLKNKIKLSHKALMSVIEFSKGELKWLGTKVSVISQQQEDFQIQHQASLILYSGISNGCFIACRSQLYFICSFLQSPFLIFLFLSSVSSLLGTQSTLSLVQAGHYFLLVVVLTYAFAKFTFFS